MKQRIIRHIRWRLLPDRALTKSVLIVAGLGVVLLGWLAIVAMR